MIELDLKQLVENAAKQAVVYAIEEAPYDTYDLHHSIKMTDFNPSDNSIEIFIDPDELGRDPKRKNIKRWNGMLYPELVHKGHKTRSGGYVGAIPFFTRALERVDFSKIPGVIFRIVKND